MVFQFKTFSLEHEKSTLKIGTDSVLLASLTSVDHADNILDIGTGCGIIAFCLAYKRSLVNQERYHVTGIDIDTESIEEAKSNLINFPCYLGQEFTFFKISLQEFSVQCNQKFDLIVSNPPYFGSSLKPENQKNKISKHRDENLSFEELMNGVAQLLSDNGKFYMILSANEQIDFDALTENVLYPFVRWEVFPNSHKPAHRIITGYSRQNVGMISQRLTIRDAQGELTDEYREITNLFYL